MDREENRDLEILFRKIGDFGGYDNVMLNKIQKDFYLVNRKEMNTLYFGLINTCKKRFTISSLYLKLIIFLIS